MTPKALLLLFIIFLSLSVTAQEHTEEPDQPARATTDPGLFGKIVDAKTKKGIEAASVQLFLLSGNSEKRIAGMLTKPNGDFRFLRLHSSDSFSIKITAMGYTENARTIAARQKTNKPGLDLGNIKLLTESALLGAVTVTAAKKPGMQMGIDRKIFNVDKNLSSTGGTAIDVMRNIPSVSIDVEGNVQLRNASPQIFVDGRPTILTLQQIPADDIERIELITNPSAKFDAASAGGIINVVLKKNRRKGFNGILTAGVGTPGVLNGGLNMNLRQGKLNVFMNTNYNQTGGTGKGESRRQNKSEGTITDYFNQQSVTDRTRIFRNIRFGADYFIDNRNTITVWQNFIKGKFTHSQVQQQEYLDAAEELTQTGARTSQGGAHFNRNATQLSYSHNFPKTGRELTADVNIGGGTGYNNSLISNYFYTPDGATAADPNFVRNGGSNDNEQLTIQTDFVNPITEKSKIEIGLRTFIQTTGNLNNVFSLNNNTETKLPLSANVSYKETIHAAYTTYTNQWQGIKYQLGLRAEYSDFEGQLIDSAKEFGYTLPEDIGNIFDGLFPSLFITKELTENEEIQVNFSRKVRRPNFWQLNPVININDPLNISQGNSQLHPEYTNSFELNYNHKYEKGNFLGVIYFRNNQADITRYSDTITAAQYQQLGNAAIDPNAILNTFINADFTNRIGAELTLNYKIQTLELIPNINLQYRNVKATVGGTDLSNQGFNWRTKMIFNYKLAAATAALKNTNLQFMANYESKEVIPQGKNKEKFVSDFALRREFLQNNAGAVTFAVNDVFNTNRGGQIYDTEEFYQDAYSRWDVRTFKVTFSYRFGKSDLNLFGQKEKED